MEAMATVDNPRILVVEDEPAIADTLVYALKTEGFDPVHCMTGGAARAEIDRNEPALVILDVGLPDCSGFDWCRELRKTCAVPVLFLTARNSEIDRVVGLEIGGDDYVTKPFSLKELHARVQAALRRAGGARSVYKFGPVEVDLDNYVIRHSGFEERLSNREQELLRFLIEHSGQVLPRELLLTSIWQYNPNVTTRTVDTHILNVRKKLGDDAQNPRFIETMHGVGYRFIAEEG